MKKTLFLILFIIITSFAPVFSTMITGGVEYNLNSAREEVLNSDIKPYDKKLTITNLVDVKHNENHKYLLNGQTELKDRILAKFSDNSYAIIFKFTPLEVLYYSPDGILTHIETKTSKDFPNRAYKYSSRGKLVNMTLNVSKEEAYIFTPDGKLIAHWEGEKCFDEFGKVIMTRKIYR